MRLGRVTAAAVALTALVAGCSGGEQANETLPSSSSSAAETTESLPPLGPPDFPMPAEARQQTEAGAEAFLRYYMDIYTKAQSEMDPTFLQQLSSGCEFCDALAQSLSKDAADGYTYDGGVVTFQGASLTPVTNSRTDGAFTIAQDALAVRDPSGAVVKEDAAATYNCGAVLSWSSATSSWSLTQWDVN